MKTKLRQHYQKLRATIQNRKRPLSSLFPMTKDHKFVLSYASFESELDTEELNAFLLKQGKLVLPKVLGNTLQLFHVEHFDQLKKGSWGILEPDACTEVPYNQISLAFIPGLAFDKKNHRLGYGKGFYDRLLSQLSAETIGIGFKEQLFSDSLPTEKHDIPLSRVFFIS